MTVNGFLCIHKPEGPTSFDIIRQLRRQLQIKKMGHAGTLDPLASGLLIVAVGQATRLLSYLPLDDKVYDFRIQFGEERDTGDRAGLATSTGFPFPTEEKVREILSNFEGEITQVPPRYSAIKIAGKRAYERARSGEDFEMKSRAVTIYSLTLTAFDAEMGTADFQVHCSSGTYVRTLACDIARSVKSGGYAASIHRVKVGSFSLKDAWFPADVTGVEQIVSPEILLNQWSLVSLEGEPLRMVKNGNSVKMDMADSFAWIMDTSTQRLLALGRLESGTLNILRVFPD